MKSKSETPVRAKAEKTQVKSKTGRPPLGDDARTTVLTLRVSRNELAIWRVKANRLGMTIRQYVLAPHRNDAESGKGDMK